MGWCQELRPALIQKMVWAGLSLSWGYDRVQAGEGTLGIGSKANWSSVWGEILKSLSELVSPWERRSNHPDTGIKPPVQGWMSSDTVVGSQDGPVPCRVQGEFHSADLSFLFHIFSLGCYFHDILTYK